MVDAIDRQEMSRKLTNMMLSMQQRSHMPFRQGYIAACKDAINKLNECREIETTAVVRCRECSHATERHTTLPYCTIRNRAVEPDDYCKFGEPDFM